MNLEEARQSHMYLSLFETQQKKRRTSSPSTTYLPSHASGRFSLRRSEVNRRGHKSNRQIHLWSIATIFFMSDTKHKALSWVGGRQDRVSLSPGRIKDRLDKRQVPIVCHRVASIPRSVVGKRSGKVQCQP